MLDVGDFLLFRDKKTGEVLYSEVVSVDDNDADRPYKVKDSGGGTDYWPYAKYIISSTAYPGVISADKYSVFNGQVFAKTKEGKLIVATGKAFILNSDICMVAGSVILKIPESIIFQEL